MYSGSSNSIRVMKRKYRNNYSARPLDQSKNAAGAQYISNLEALGRTRSNRVIAKKGKEGRHSQTSLPLSIAYPSPVSGHQTEIRHAAVHPWKGQCLFIFPCLSSVSETTREQGKMRETDRPPMEEPGGREGKRKDRDGRGKGDHT